MGSRLVVPGKRQVIWPGLLNDCCDRTGLSLGSSCSRVISFSFESGEQKKNGVVVVGLIRYMGKDLTDAQGT